MKILIPTRARPDAQITADALFDAGIPYTLVRTVGDDTLYPSHHDQVWAPVHGIMDKRNWILDITTQGRWWSGSHGDGLAADGLPGCVSDKKILTIDDDVKFYRVDPLSLDDPGRPVCSYRWLPCTGRDLRDMVRAIEHHLDDFAHVGTVRRFGAHKQPQPYTYNVKCLHAVGHNLARFPSPPPRYRTQAVSDFDMQMQLTMLAGNCLVLTEFCHQDGPYLAPGGCATWRTESTIRDGMLTLKARWGQYVTLVDDGRLPGAMQAHLQLKRLAKDFGWKSLPADIEERHQCHMDALRIVRESRRSRQTEQHTEESTDADASCAE